MGPESREGKFREGWVLNPIQPQSLAICLWLQLHICHGTTHWLPQGLESEQVLAEASPKHLLTEVRDVGSCPSPEVSQKIMEEWGTDCL